MMIGTGCSLVIFLFFFFQFEVLATLCSISSNALQQLLRNLDDQQLITLDLIRLDQLETETDESVNVLRRKFVADISENLAHHRMMTRFNGFITALNLNGGIMATSMFYYYSLDYFSTNYQREYSTNCKMRDQIVPAEFYISSYFTNGYMGSTFEIPTQRISSGSVDGFFSECTPTEAILSSTLDCLYDLSCLQLMFDHFPSLDRVGFYFYPTSFDEVSLSFSVCLELVYPDASWISQ